MMRFAREALAQLLERCATCRCRASPAQQHGLAFAARRACSHAWSSGHLLLAADEPAARPATWGGFEAGGGDLARHPPDAHRVGHALEAAVRRDRRSGKAPRVSARVPSAMTTVSGLAKACSRAARLGVSPIAESSEAPRGAATSPTTTMPVAIPMRTASRWPLARRQPADGLDNAPSRTDRAFGRVLVGVGIAEIGKDAVAQELGEIAVVSRHDAGASVLVGAHDVAHVFGIGAGGKLAWSRRDRRTSP